jgi:hypothetical protein
MDDKHDEVPGYAYDSNACFGCHMDGTAAPQGGVRPGRESGEGGGEDPGRREDPGRKRRRTPAALDGPGFRLR